MRDAGIDGKLTDALQGHAGTSIADSYGRDAEGMGVFHARAVPGLV